MEPAKFSLANPLINFCGCKGTFYDVIIMVNRKSLPAAPFYLPNFLKYPYYQ